MRSYRLCTDDTLRSIARTKYYIYDDQGNEDADRLYTVAREIIKWNPQGPSIFKKAHTLHAPDSGADNQSRGRQACDAVEQVLDVPFNVPKEPRSWFGTRIVLPHVPGISAYNACRRSTLIHLLPWLFLLIWLLGGIAGAWFTLRRQRGNLSVQLFDWLLLQLLSPDTSPWQIVNAVLPWLCVWTLVMWGLWLAICPLSSSPVRRSRQRFLLGWIFGLVVLLPGLRILIDSVVPLAAPTLRQFNDLFPLVITWTFVIFLLYLYLSDGSVLHAEYLLPHRGIWTVLATMLLGTVLAGYAGYQQVTARIHGDLSALTLARSTLLDLRESAHRLHDGVNDWIQTVQFGNDADSTNQLQDVVSRISPDRRARLVDRWSVIERNASSVTLQARDAQTYIRQAIQHYQNACSFLGVQRDQETSQNAGNCISSKAANATAETQGQGGSDNSGTDAVYLTQQIDALEQISTILTTTMAATKPLTTTLADLRPISLFQGTALTQDITATQSITQAVIMQNLLRQAEDVVAKADVADAAMAGIGFDGLPIFLWNGLLYGVLVLFPWMLLLLFLYRKRENLAAQIYDDLLRLDPKCGLLKRVLQGNSAHREQRHIQKLLRHLDQLRAHALREETAGDESLFSAQRAKLPNSGPPQQSPAEGENGKSVATQAGMPSDPRSAEQPEQEAQEIVDALAKRTFGEFEYLISLVFLTLLLAVGWYYVFYPQTSIGLTFLIERGAGVRQMLAFLTANLTPLTLGFAGAYFFLMQMLVRRYLANDLYPTAFLQAALRLLIVVLLSLALTLLPAIWMDPSANVFARNLAVSSTIALLVAFLVGIFPTSGLKLIITTINGWFRRQVFPPTLVPEPLTKLTGVTVWVEARLFEENIESIEAMATAQIEQLIVNTHFSTAEIVDWVDQAILYLHAGHDGEWFPQLRAVGIRGASDLLDGAGLNLLAPYESMVHSRNPQNGKHEQHEFHPDATALVCLANAITEANASGVPRPTLDDPRGIAASMMEDVRRAADRGAQQAKQAATLIQNIDLAKPETYNYPRQIDDAIQKMKNSLNEIGGAIPAVEQAANKALESSPNKQSVLKSIEQLNIEVQKARTMLQQVPAINKTKSETPEVIELNDPKPIQLQITELRATLAAAEKILDNIANFIQQLAQAGISEPERQELAKAVDDVQKLWEPLKDLDTIDQKVQRLDVHRAATYDARAEFANYAEQMVTSRQTLASNLAQLRTVVTGGDITLTYAQRKTVEPALENAEQAVQMLSQPTEHAYNYSRKLWPLAQFAPAQVEFRKEEAARVSEVFASAHEKLKFLDTALATVVQPPQLTADILHVICDTIWPDPNIAYILNYNERTINDLRRAP